MYRLLIVFVLVSFFLSSAKQASGSEDYISTIMAFVERLTSHHRTLTGQDVYKALFQYVNGMEHIISDKESARKMLLYELEKTDVNMIPDEKMIEYLSDDLTVCRINLRPFKMTGGNPESLLEAMILSSQHFNKNTERFRELWHAFIFLVKGKKLNFDIYEVSQIDSNARSHNYERNFSHSETYRKTYNPAYRVILSKYLEVIKFTN